MWVAARMAAVTAAALGLAMILEGGSSILIVGAEATRSDPLPDYKQHDPELGWTSQPSFAAPDWYGPGIALHTNARGFRGRATVTDSLGPGERRIVCSGDSFTFGKGVRDDDTWCAQLARPGQQAVNMGQEAYGVDQAYLWYRRDARQLEHTDHILAVITHDFARAAMRSFTGVQKPYLVLAADSLRVTNVPTPPRRAPSRASQLAQSIRRLRVVELLVRARNEGSAVEVGLAPETDSGRVRDVVARLLADLVTINRSKRSRLTILYLPVFPDYVTDASRWWRRQVTTISDSLDIGFLDLVPELRLLDEASVRDLYLGRPSLRGSEASPYGGAGVHLSVEGHRWVAQHVLAYLHPRRPALRASRD